MTKQIVFAVIVLPIVLATCTPTMSTSHTVTTPIPNGEVSIETLPLTTNIKPPNPKKTPMPISVDPVKQTKPIGLQSGISVNVTRVIDGDTIEVDVSGRIYTVRYIAIDSPESVNPRTSIQCFGHEASKKNTELVEGKTVYLEHDTLPTNRYGHLLRYVWLNDEVLVNEALVAEGFAKVNVYPPNTKYVDRLMAAQEQAQKLGNGMWGQCFYNDSLAPIPTGTVIP